MARNYWNCIKFDRKRGKKIWLTGYFFVGWVGRPLCTGDLAGGWDFAFKAILKRFKRLSTMR